MRSPQNKVLIFTLASISILLLFSIFAWFHYLVQNDYVVECFSSLLVDEGSSLTSHTVDLPINTTYSCQNICGPLARCSITGEQCTSDIDCKGCQPILNIENQKVTKPAYGDNDAGKLLSPTSSAYSALTTDIGTQARIYDWNVFKKAPNYNKGKDTWTEKYNAGMTLFNQRYEPSKLQFLPFYPSRYTLSGEFHDVGPVSSNDYLSIRPYHITN